MRIAHVISSINPATGGTIESLKLRNRLYKKLGFECEIITLDIVLKKFLKDKNLPRVRFSGKSRFKIINYFNLFKWLNKNTKSYDLIICDGIWEFINYVVYKCAIKNNINYMVQIHGMLDPWFNKKKLKYIKKLIYWWLVQYKVLKNSKAVLFTSIQEKHLARKSNFFPYKFTEKIYGYPNIKNPYINNKGNSLINTYSYLKNKKILLYLGRIHEKKGLDLLLYAFKDVIKFNKKIHLVISGPHKTDFFYQKIINIIKKLNIKNYITFTGPLYGKEKWDAFNACDIFCLPTHQENFGITISEALSSNKPVIITNKTNIWKIIRDSNSGFVSEDSIGGIKSSLKKWIMLDNKKYNKMCSASKTCFKENFSEEKVKFELKDILNFDN